jgi:hypothetical protein
MEQTIPIEECARQRLQVMVYAFTMFTKNLMEAGVDRDKVKNASDKVWAVLGEQAAGQLKPMFGDTINISALEQAGAIAEEVHGIEVTREASESEIRTKFTKCPWHEAANAMEMPEDWRFCDSGHTAFTTSMYKGLDPKATYELPKAMSAGDSFCEGISKLG